MLFGDGWDDHAALTCSRNGSRIGDSRQHRQYRTSNETLGLLVRNSDLWSDKRTRQSRQAQGLVVHRTSGARASGTSRSACVCCSMLALLDGEFPEGIEPDLPTGRRRRPVQASEPKGRALSPGGPKRSGGGAKRLDRRTSRRLRVLDGGSLRAGWPPAAAKSREVHESIGGDCRNDEFPHSRQSKLQDLRPNIGQSTTRATNALLVALPVGTAGQCRCGIKSGYRTWSPRVESCRMRSIHGLFNFGMTIRTKCGRAPIAARLPRPNRYVTDKHRGLIEPQGLWCASWVTYPPFVHRQRPADRAG